MAKVMARKNLSLPPATRKLSKVARGGIQPKSSDPITIVNKTASKIEKLAADMGVKWGIPKNIAKTK